MSPSAVSESTSTVSLMIVMPTKYTRPMALNASVALAGVRYFGCTSPSARGRAPRSAIDSRVRAPPMGRKMPPAIAPVSTAAMSRTSKVDPRTSVPSSPRMSSGASAMRSGPAKASTPTALTT